FVREGCVPEADLRRVGSDGDGPAVDEGADPTRGTVAAIAAGPQSSRSRASRARRAADTTCSTDYLVAVTGFSEDAGRHAQVRCDDGDSAAISRAAAPAERAHAAIASASRTRAARPACPACPAGASRHLIGKEGIGGIRPDGQVAALIKHGTTVGRTTVAARAAVPSHQTGGADAAYATCAARAALRASFAERTAVQCDSISRVVQTTALSNTAAAADTADTGGTCSGTDTAVAGVPANSS